MIYRQHAKRRGEQIDGDVVMGRADLARGEQIVVGIAQGVDGLDDSRLAVGDDTDLGQPDPLHVQPGGDLRDVAVLGPPRQDFIADHYQRGSPNLAQNAPPFNFCDALSYLGPMTEYIHVGPEDRTEARSHVIKLHGPEGFEGMRRAGRLAATILDHLAAHIVPGVTTGEIDDIVQRMTLDAGAIPATLGYRGYSRQVLHLD